MKKRTKLSILAVALTSVFAAACFAEVPTTSGKISSVTVYRGQALVTRTIDADLPAGTSELIVTDLPAKIISESLYAQTVGGVKILSVRYREKAVEQDTREEVKKLDEQISTIKNQIYQAERKKGHLDNQWSMFIKLRDFTATAAKTDLDHGLLTFEPIANLTELIQTQGTEYIDQVLKFEDEISEFKKQLELLNRKRAKLDAGRSRTERQAVLFIAKDGNKKATIELKYLVNGANWLPKYNLRADNAQTKAIIEYNAVVNQTSGEDWNGIGLSLSTAQPTMVAAPPSLDPMLISLAMGIGAGSDMSYNVPIAQSEGQMQQMAAKSTYRDISGEFSRIQKKRRSSARRGKQAQVTLNSAAFENQMLEFVADSRAVRVIQKQAENFARTEGVSVTYRLDGKLTLPSRTDQQLINIATIDAKADFVLVATPLLTDYVYRQADILNDSEKILLPGPANMYLNGDFVGTDNIKLVTVGEKFTAGFGVDSQIQVRREFKDKKTESLWGNHIETYDYRIAISNYKKTPVKLQLLDRLPYTKDETLGIGEFKTNIELSKDAEYLRTQKDKGILRWDMTLKGETTEKNATIVTYGFTMKYDNDMHIRSN